MSVVQHIRDRAGRFRWMGLLVVWAVFIVMAAVLLVELSLIHIWLRFHLILQLLVITSLQKITLKTEP